MIQIQLASAANHGNNEAMVNRVPGQKVLVVLLLLSVVALGGCVEYEERDLAVENGTSRALRIVVEGGTRPSVTFILHPGEVKSVPLRKDHAPFSVRVCETVDVCVEAPEEVLSWAELRQREFKVKFQ